MQHPHPSRAPYASAARREDGFGLIEVLVTAVVVIIIGTAIFAGLDAASSASGRTKSRSVASTLAQRDQERLRALDVDQLNNLRQSSTLPSCDDDGKACITYTIDSRTQWIADSTGAASCTAADGRADYLELVSTITWPDMRGSKPVVIKSIYSPPVGSFGPTQGTLAVQLVGADGVRPIKGVQVRLSGPASFSDRTNELGCVVWGYLPAGNGYTIALDEPGYVDPQGVQAVSASASVVGEALTRRTFLYDKSASANVSFFSRIGSTDYPGQRAEQITVGHTQMQPTTRTFAATPAGSAQPGITTPALFPFASTTPGGPYRIFGGGCNGQDPSKQAPPDPALLTLPDLTPGVHGVPHALRLPAIDTKVTVAGSAPDAANEPKYKVTQTTPSCTSAVTPALADTPVAPDPNAGRLMQMGRPYGTYLVCAQAKIGTLIYREAYTAPITTLAGVQVPSSGTPGVVNITTADQQKDCDAPIP